MDETDLVERLKLRADALRSEGQAMRAYLEDQAAAEIARLRAALDEAKESIFLLEYDAKNTKIEGEKRNNYLWRVMAELDAMTAERDAAIITAVSLAEDESEKAFVAQKIAAAIRAMKEPKT